MAYLSAFQSWYGRDLPPPVVTQLRTGGLSLEFENGDLRSIRAGQRELVRRIYVAIRDPNWNTIPGLISNLDVQTGADRFRIQYDSFHQAGPLAFQWHADFAGFPDGHIEITLDGAAETDFRYNRIGFCVLHPIRGIAGRPYQALTPQGMIEGTLPEIIAPQQMVNGFEAPIFPSCSELRIDLDSETRLMTVFEGDLFEMEDQRNWTDGSFKTYGTPLSLGYPHQAKAGQTFHQKLFLRVEMPEQAVPAFDASSASPVQLTLGGPSARRLPSIGFGLPDSAEALNPLERLLLTHLHADHLKVSLHLGSLGWEAELARGFDTADRMHCALELVLFLDDHPERALQALAARLHGRAVARVIVFHEDEAGRASTSARWMNLARAHLAPNLPGTPLLGGTNGNFAELNRQPPDLSSIDGVVYPINPQVHAFDERSLIEGMAAQQDTLTAARNFSGSLPISVSSVTLRPPFNQAVNEPELARDPNKLPPSVDPRQMSLFAAAWTAGSLASLSAGGADSVTYYETSGWQGLFETQAGNPLPEKFPSFPGMVFPVYWIFSFLSEAKQAECIEVTPADSLLAGGLVLKKDDRWWLVLSNYRAVEQSILVSPIPHGPGVIRRLNQENIEMAASAPESYCTQFQPLALSGDTLAITLSAYETVFVEVQIQS